MTASKHVSAGSRDSTKSAARFALPPVHGADAAADATNHRRTRFAQTRLRPNAANMSLVEVRLFGADLPICAISIHVIAEPTLALLFHNQFSGGESEGDFAIVPGA